jgi:hypothetical protein
LDFTEKDYPSDPRQAVSPFAAEASCDFRERRKYLTSLLHDRVREFNCRVASIGVQPIGTGQKPASVKSLGRIVGNASKWLAARHNGLWKT